MDDSINSGSENKLPLIVSVVAIAAAVFALALAVKAKNDAKTANESLTTANGTITALQGEVSSLRGTMVKSADLQDIKNEFESFKGEAITKVNDVVTQVEAQRKILEGMKAGKATGTTTTGGTAPVAGPGEYVIKSGDTPRKIATANGVSVSDLLKVNPGMDPTKLRVGQKIKLPAKK